MNTDTGLIKQFTKEELEMALEMGERLVEVDPSLMTEKQKLNMAVSLHDTRSALGKQLRADRSRYEPHMGKKQKDKLEKK